MTQIEFNKLKEVYDILYNFKEGYISINGNKIHLSNKFDDHIELSYKHNITGHTDVYIDIHSDYNQEVEFFQSLDFKKVIYLESPLKDFEF